VIDEAALAGAASNGRIKGAALDVFDHEPLRKATRSTNWKCSAFSHCADHTLDWLDNACVFFIEQFERFRKGKPLLNVVDKKLGY